MFSPSNINVFDNINEAFFILNNKWQIEYANHQAEFLLQLTKEDLIGKHFPGILPDAVGSKLYSSYHEMIDDLNSIHIDVFFPSLKKWFQVSISSSWQNIFVYFLDVTDRKQAQKALRVNESLKQAILDSLTAHIAVLNREGTIIAVNAAWDAYAKANSNGYITKSLGLNYLEICDKTTGKDAAIAQKAAQGIRSILQGHHSDFFLDYPCHAPNQPRWFLMQVTPLLNMPGAVISHIDVTERKLAERALEANALQTQQILSSHIASIIICENEYIIQANDLFLKTFGYQKEDIEQKHLKWKNMTPPDYMEIDQKAFNDLYKLGVSEPYEKEFFHKNGSLIPVEMKVARYQDEPFRWIGFIFDLTQQKILEQRQNDFISIANHELTAPMTSLKGLVQLCKRACEKQGDQLPLLYLSKIESQLDSLTYTINNVLDASKILVNQLVFEDELIDLMSLLHEVISTIQQSAVTCTISITGSTQQKFLGDRKKLKRVFISLVENAIVYSQQVHKITINVSSSQGFIMVSVQDYGFGIAQEYQPLMFEQLYRSSQREGGPVPGLELYIVHEIVKHYGGKLIVESASGKGSRFSVTLPVAIE